LIALLTILYRAHDLTHFTPALYCGQKESLTHKGAAARPAPHGKRIKMTWFLFFLMK
jgi:hypothetical protein